LREALRTVPLTNSLITGALPGQSVVIRYPRLPDMPDNQIAGAIEREAGQNIPYDLAEVFLDWTLLGTEGEGEETTLKVLLVAAKHDVIDSRVQIAELAGVQYGVLTVDSLALADAAENCDFLRVGESVALLNLGASATSIHFTRDGASNFIRDVSWGARDMVQAIAKGRRCDYAEAQLLLEQAMFEESAAEEDESSGVPEQPEPGGGADLDFGGSLLDPLDEELGGLGEAPAPASAAAPAPGAAQGERPLAELLETPLARLVSELRRSFDYYEQQLYEHPVDRLILSGGVAQLPIVRETLMVDLGISEVEVANPTDSALLLGRDASLRLLRDHPAQFMVAVGLAARGTLEL